MILWMIENYESKNLFSKIPWSMEMASFRMRLDTTYFSKN